ncbi:hypothetical protein ABZ930_34850 [Streptomyces sp. NPDC046716]|uniref:hypothetical protein n=1 Tax=Streptomyces sp. NPDC046716 TaxID=3157093 RepID=UPI0033C7189A
MKRVLRHELRVLASLGLWVTRRRDGVGAGARAFPYARAQAVMMYAFVFVCVVESCGMWVLLRGLPVLHGIVLVLDVYTVLMVLGLHAAAVTRPHVVTEDALRVRRGAHVDLRIPFERIARVRRENRYMHTPTDGELDLDVGAQTTVTLELAEPVRHFTFFGRPKDVRVVRLYAEDTDALDRALTDALTRARTAPSPVPDPPA